MTRYVPARHYFWFSMAAVMLAGVSAWLALAMKPFSVGAIALAFVPSALFLLTAGLLFALALRPALEVHEGYLAIGRRIIPWMDIRRLDRSGWISPSGDGVRRSPIMGRSRLAFR